MTDDLSSETLTDRQVRYAAALGADWLITLTAVREWGPKLDPERQYWLTDRLMDEGLGSKRARTQFVLDCAAEDGLMVEGDGVRSSLGTLS